MVGYEEAKQGMNKLTKERRTEVGIGCFSYLMSGILQVGGIGMALHGMAIENEYEILAGLGFGFLGVYNSWINKKRYHKTLEDRRDQKRLEMESLEHALNIKKHQWLTKDFRDLEDKVIDIEEKVEKFKPQGRSKDSGGVS